MAVDLVELQTELLTDPNNYGYAAHVAAGRLSELADLLNLRRPEIAVDREIVLGVLIRGQLNMAEYTALSPVRQQLCDSYTSGDIDLRLAPAMRTQIETLFNSTGTTVTGLAPLWTRDGSRAEELWGVGIFVTTQDCSAALALPPPPLTAVPDNYTPNYSLGWVIKATHIWALHPEDPLRADKGGNTLQLVTGAVAVPSVFSDNTMEFHGGDPSTASYYKTSSSIIFGDDPLTAGNQTPPTIGAVSFWLNCYTGAPAGGFAIRFFGPQAVLVNTCVLIHYNSTPNLLGTVQFSTAVAPPPQNQWVHVCLTHSATHRRVYVNGVKVGEGTNPTALTMSDLIYGIGCALGSGPASVALTGRMRLVAMVNGAVWTDAEILEQYEHPYRYYEG